MMTDITIRRPVQWLSASTTNVGVVRKINEDAVFSKPDINLWAVADGMGGHEAGNVASNMIVNMLNDIETEINLDTFVSTIEDKILDVNKRLLEYSEIMLEGRIIGSTVAILLIKGRVGICLWAGDSRLYRYRNNDIEQMTVDHSHVAELLKNGTISIGEAENHPDANVITRAVGTCEDLYVDIDVFDVSVGDTFMLCTDGLYNAVNEESIINCLQEDDVEIAANNLIETSLHNGASDNVSVVLVKGVRSSTTSQ
ncbi:MAG: serine/threonine-protein phosphatase [Gammaproteobacteria bacterium]|nr:serine/threonine-protein phosphatase [Gammaproteobacteria bacterium]